MQLTTAPKAETRYNSAEAVVAPGGWCCCSCSWCWCHIGNAMHQELEDDEVL